jgi:hypothetical protein
MNTTRPKDAAFLRKGGLWKYDLSTGSLQPVLKAFRAYTYFFGLNGDRSKTVASGHRSSKERIALLPALLQTAKPTLQNAAVELPQLELPRYLL